MERHEELARIYTELQNNLRSFYNKGNKAAGTRARLLCVDMKKLMGEIRTDILAVKKSAQNQ